VEEFTERSNLIIAAVGAGAKSRDLRAYTLPIPPLVKEISVLLAEIVFPALPMAAILSNLLTAA
jgi:hypothetical protein